MVITTNQKAVLPQVRPPPTLREMAFDAIKNAIMTNALRAGEVFTEQALASDLGMSKTPVHEALIDLSARGFIELLPRKGFRVNLLSEVDVGNLYEFRRLIESAIVRQVAPSLSAEDLGQLKAIHSKCCEKTMLEDPVAYMKQDRNLHGLLASRTKNKYLMAALENIRDLVDWMGTVALTRPERLEEVNAEHERLLKMLESGDVEKAERAMQDHVCATAENVMRTCSKGTS